MPMSALEQIERCEANQIEIERRVGITKPRMPAKDAAPKLQAVFAALRALLPDERIGDLSGPDGLIADQEKALGILA